MATLMQKDVLIELVAYVRSIIMKTVPTNELNQNLDLAYLKHLRGDIYSITAHELDYETLVKDINIIKIKYKDLPQIPLESY